MSLSMKSWFRAIAAAFKSAAPAQAIAGLTTLVLVLYTGYSIPQPYMIGALRWITWLNVRRRAPTCLRTIFSDGDAILYI